MFGGQDEFMFENEEESKRGDVIYEGWKLLLEELLAFCNGKSNPICILFAKELRRATNKYDQRRCFLQDVVFEFYKGYLEGHLISVKKFRDEKKLS